MSKTKTKTGAPVALNFFTLFVALFDGGLKDLLAALVAAKEALQAVAETAKPFEAVVEKDKKAKHFLEQGARMDNAPSEEEVESAKAELLILAEEKKKLTAALEEVKENIKEAFAPYDAAFTTLGLQAQSFWKDVRTLRLVATSAEEAADLRKALRKVGVEVKDLRGGLELTFTVKL